MAQYVPVAIFVRAREGGLPDDATTDVTGGQRAVPVNEGDHNRP
jgi:hypothetical protein